MAIRIRNVGGIMVAICAAMSVEKPGDIYIGDAQHHALSEKFAEDFASEGYDIHPLCPDETAVRHAEEENNSARTWWDKTYPAPAPEETGAASLDTSPGGQDGL